MTQPTPFTEQDISRLFAALAGQDEVMLLETTRLSAENHTSLLFVRPESALVLEQDGDPRRFLDEAQQWLSRGYYLAGWLSYELGYLLEPTLTGLARRANGAPLARLLACRQPIIFDHNDPAGLRRALTDLCPEDSPVPADDAYVISNSRLSLTKADYVRAIKRIRDYIKAGDTYQVNYTLKYLFDFTGSAEALYLALRRSQSVGYGAFLRSAAHHILSLSPELFFRQMGPTITVRPMKGTLARGRTLTEDEEKRRLLASDRKNRSENVMIVDLLRNDLGRLCRAGTVRVSSLFDVETYETLLQMTSTITGELAGEVSLHALFAALFPCGSVTGAPKIRTMEIIRELEPEARGVYTGAIGYLTPDGEAVFNVPIRTVVLHGNAGEMGVGSGIVYDSEPEREWQECRLKANFLLAPRPCFDLIETLLWQPAGGFWLLEEHLTRLADSAAYFRYPCRLTEIRTLLTNEDAKLRGQSDHQRLRLLLDRQGHVTVSVTPCGGPPATCDDGGNDVPRIIFATSRTSSTDIFLFHKTTHREIYERERSRAMEGGYYEVLFCNERGEVTEGAISSVFIRQGDVLYTPPLTCGLLPGILRGHLLAGTAPLVREKILFPDDLARAEAIYVGNSVRGLVRVRL
ncbi:MAG: aminodeoxychorismate synthase component I [Thermodesulfobacteriota bacterium]